MLNLSLELEFRLIFINQFIILQDFAQKYYTKSEENRRRGREGEIKKTYTYLMR